MSNIKTSNISSPQTEADDPRVDTFIKEKNNHPKAVLIGFPSDEGVRRNGGRPGAAEAPDKIRKMLYKLTPDVQEPEEFINLLEHTNDIGNIEVSGDLEADQQLLGSTIIDYLKQGIVPIILGGGHEAAFGHFLGYAKAGLATTIFNLDAHTDVRPLKNGKAHSGSPFRQALEHESGCCKTYNVAGLQPHAIAQSHLQFIENHSGHAIYRGRTDIEVITNQLVNIKNRCMITFDMDAVDQAFAPGVSAPCTNGLNPDLWLKAAFLAGKNKRVTSFDLSEVNPTYDRDGQTARLAALTVWHFLRGLSQRI